MQKSLLLIVALALCAGGFASAGPIHDAATNGDLGQIKTILSDNPTQVNDKDARNNTPLHLAAGGGHLEVVKFLVSKGADINLGDNENSPPIVNAALRSHPEIVRFMLDNGASATLADDNGATALHFGCMGGDTLIVRMLLDKGADVNAVTNGGLSPIMYAAYRGKPDALRLMAEKGADLNTRSGDGKGLIHAAALVGSVEMLEYLTAAGADVNVRDSNDETPLFGAVARGKVEATRWLIDHGADVNKISIFGEGPLHMAVFSDNPELVEMILNAGADVNRATAFGRTPLHYTTFGNSVEAARTLLAHGANPNVSDQVGSTPLYGAARNGYTEICDLLLANGARADFREIKNGRTPLSVASIKGQTEIVRSLVDHGADVNARDDAGRTSLYYAGKYGNKSAADILAAKNGKAENMERNFGPSPLLKKSLAQKDAIVWYTGHSGWTVKTKNHLLVFDFWGGESSPTEPCLANGYINPSEIGDLPVTVFVSHNHRDHYDPTIWGWRDSIPNITYVMGFEPDSAQGYEYLAPRSVKTYDGVKVSTITSNDSGVGFLVEVDGLVIFHSGDHANRQRDFSGPFKAEIDYLADMNKSIDLAFMPISGCGFGDQEAVKLGVYYTLEKLAPNLIFPSHAVDNEIRYREFADEAAGQNFKSKFICAENKGDRFIYQSGSVAF